MCGIALAGAFGQGTKNNPSAIPFTGLLPALISPKKAAKVNDSIAKISPLGLGSKLLSNQFNTASTNG